MAFLAFPFYPSTRQPSHPNFSTLVQKYFCRLTLGKIKSHKTKQNKQKDLRGFCGKKSAPIHWGGAIFCKGKSHPSPPKFWLLPTKNHRNNDDPKNNVNVKKTPKTTRNSKPPSSFCCGAVFRVRVVSVQEIMPSWAFGGVARGFSRVPSWIVWSCLVVVV